jgi:hypothetical protein
MEALRVLLLLLVLVLMLGATGQNIGTDTMLFRLATLHMEVRPAGLARRITLCSLLLRIVLYSGIDEPKYSFLRAKRRSDGVGDAWKLGRRLFHKRGNILLHVSAGGEKVGVANNMTCSLLNTAPKRF